MVIGVKNDKTIGIYLNDSGLLKKDKIAHELFTPEDLASDYLLMFTAPVDNVHDIIAIDFTEPHSQIILRYTLIFMQAHLVSVNTKGSLTEKERIYMLWS